MIAIRTGLIATMLIGPFIFAADADIGAGFRRIGLFAAIVIAAASVIVFVTTSDAPRNERPYIKFDPGKELSALWKNQPFKVLFCAHLLKFTGIGAAGTSVIYYLVFALNVPSQSVGVVLSTAAATATLFLPFWMWVMQKWGKQQAYSAALAILAAAMLPLLFLGSDTFSFSVVIPYVAEAVNGVVVVVVGILIVASLGDSGAILAPNAMVPDTVEADELATGVRREGTILGAWAFSRKLGMALGAYAISLVLSWSGFMQGNEDQTEAAVLGIRLGYVLFPVSCYIAAWFVLRNYTLSEARFEEIKSDLADRAGA